MAQMITLAQQTQVASEVFGDVVEMHAASGPLQMEVAPIGAAIAAVTAIASHRAAQRGVGLGLTAMPGLTTRADQFRLQQVLTAILAYAIDTAPDGGHVALRCFRSDGLVRVLIEVAGSPQVRYAIMDMAETAGGEVIPGELSGSQQLMREMGGDVVPAVWPGLHRFTVAIPEPR